MSLGKEKILIVGSSPKDWPIFNEALYEFEVLFDGDGSTAVDLLTKDSFAVVLINHQLPKGNGLILMREIKLKNQRKIPVILMIKTGEEKQAVTAMKDGAADYLSLDEIIPSIITMAVKRTLEQQRWQMVYDSLSTQAASQSTFLKDPLTGTYNQCYLEMRMKEEIKRSQRYHFPITLAFFNVDGFHHINERYGIEAGDRVLTSLAEVLIKDIRPSDLLARIRSDHFMLLLPHTDVLQAEVVWKRISQETAKTAFMVKNENVFIRLNGAIMPLVQNIEKVETLLEIIFKRLTHAEKEAREPLLFKEESF